MANDEKQIKAWIGHEVKIGGDATRVEDAIRLSLKRIDDGEAGAVVIEDLVKTGVSVGTAYQVVASRTPTAPPRPAVLPGSTTVPSRWLTIAVCVVSVIIVIGVAVFNADDQTGLLEEGVSKDRGQSVAKFYKAKEITMYRASILSSYADAYEEMVACPHFMYQSL